MHVNSRVFKRSLTQRQLVIDGCRFYGQAALWLNRQFLLFLSRSGSLHFHVRIWRVKHRRTKNVCMQHNKAPAPANQAQTGRPWEWKSTLQHPEKIYIFARNRKHITLTDVINMYFHTIMIFLNGQASRLANQVVSSSARSNYIFWFFGFHGSAIAIGHLGWHGNRYASE